MYSTILRLLTNLGHHGDEEKSRRFIPAWYSPYMWCYHNAVFKEAARTNNFPEGWQGRLQVRMAKDHQSFYKFLAELKKKAGR